MTAMMYFMLLPFLSFTFHRAAASFGLRGGGRLVTVDIKKKAKTVPEFWKTGGTKNPAPLPSKATGPEIDVESEKKDGYHAAMTSVILSNSERMKAS